MSDIQTLMEVTGLDRAAALRVLTVSNNNLERAINFHLEGNTIDEPPPIAAGSIDDEAAAVGGRPRLANGGGAPSMPQLGGDDDDDLTDPPLMVGGGGDDDDDGVRAPIPVRREQMVQPEDDQFRMRVRRPFVTPFGVHNVCPLRNFQLEGELQEQQLYEAAGVDRDPIMQLAAGVTAAAASSAHSSRAASMVGAARVAAARAAVADLTRGGAAARRAKRSRLGDLFRPPVDLSVVGSLQTIKDTAKQRNRWVIVNLQDNADFASQVLNRDVWSDAALRTMIGRYFVFWQIAVDMPEGARFQSFYGARQLPYVCIIDPQTGEEKCNYKSETTAEPTPSGSHTSATSRSAPQVSSPFRHNATQFLAELRSFLLTQGVSPDPAAAADIDEADLIADNLAATPVDAATTTAIAAARRAELSEDEQLRLAIENSLRESAAAAAGSARPSRSTSSSPARKMAKLGSDSDDEADTDADTFDDEATSAAHRAAVRRPSSHRTTVKAAAAVDDEAVAAFHPVDLPSQYARHLGDSGDPLTKLQLRLPDGRRENLEWPCSSRIRALRLYVEHVYPEVTRLPYKLLCPYPRKDLLELDGGETLLGAKLHPSVLLHVHQDD